MIISFMQSLSAVAIGWGRVMASELERATAALVEVMARPIEAYSSGEAGSSNFGQAMANTGVVEIEDQMVQLELDFDAKEDELKMTRKKLANTRMKLNRSRSARVILKQEVLKLKADVQVWRDRATETMLAFGKSSEIFANLTKTLAPKTSQSSSQASSEEGGIEEYKPHIS